MEKYVLIACEESQRVCCAFRQLGIQAFSCDILPCSGNHPEWHIQHDVIPLLNGNCSFRTMDGSYHYIIGQWDLIVAHPPCTYLSCTGNRWFDISRYGDKARERIIQREVAVQFFIDIALADCEHILIENPVGVMSTRFSAPSQIVQPYYFGDPYEKRTCLWLKNLPLLQPTNYVTPEERKKFKSGKSMPKWYCDVPVHSRSLIRSRTFPGFANAIALQYSQVI